MKSDEYHLETRSKIGAFSQKDRARAWLVSQDNFPVLEDITCYTLELWDESMRVPHWHPNASELGYVISGSVQIIIWRSPGESAVFNVEAGMCWFIPQGALHSLNNIGAHKAELLVGFSSHKPQDIDLPVAFNGVPAFLRDAYTSPHSDLKKWRGPCANPLVSKFSVFSPPHQSTGSPYKFDLAQVTPLFQDPKLGSITWGIKDNWNILQNISLLRAQLKPKTARDAIWYPDAGTLYIVAHGTGQFQHVFADKEPRLFVIKQFDYIFVPTGILHTFVNNASEDLELIAFFNKADPKPEISLSVATSFFPESLRKEAMTEYKNPPDNSNPLKELKFTLQTPYLIDISDKKI
jgi:oxalate decarboxylase